MLHSSPLSKQSYKKNKLRNDDPTKPEAKYRSAFFATELATRYRSAYLVTAITTRTALLKRVNASDLCGRGRRKASELGYAPIRAISARVASSQSCKYTSYLGRKGNKKMRLSHRRYLIYAMLLPKKENANDFKSFKMCWKLLNQNQRTIMYGTTSLLNWQ